MNLTLRILPLLAFALLVSLAPLHPAAADGELRVSVREVSSGQSSQVQILAKVVDQNGKPIAGLTPANFAVNVGDKKIPVSRVQSATDAQVGISSLLLVDTSGSMVGGPIAAARAAAGQYVQSLQPVDEVGVFSFANSVQPIADFSQDFAAVQSQLPRLTAFGDTALYDAVSDAAARMAARQSARRVVILLSDGADFGISGASRAQALTDATNSGVPFYVIGLGPAIDASFLQQLAEATGGVYFAAPSSAQLANLFGQISELLRSEYVVTADFSESGLSGPTQATFRAESQSGNGEVAIGLTLPAVPTQPSASGSVPTPIETVPEPVSSGGGSGAVVILLLLLVLAVALGAWFYLRKRRKARREQYVFGGPAIITPRGAGTDVAPREAPRAVLRLDSGEEFLLEGMATLGIDPDCTFKLPLSNTEFGHGELRVWFANQRYMIHDTASRSRIRVNGRPVSISPLGDGDSIEIRGLTLHFALQPAVATASQE